MYACPWACMGIMQREEHMSKCGVPRIDDLFAGQPAVPPIAAGEADRESVGAVQDLLRGHGFASLPDPRASAYGSFGDLTRAAVRTFRGNNGLPSAESVDGPTLKALVTAP